jgi:hypothetical protein
MKQLTSLCYSAILMFTSIPCAFAAPEINFSDLVYYSGIDLQQRGVQLKQGYGSGMFADRLPQLNVYFGTKINDYFAIEIGYESTSEEEKSATLYSGESLFGTVIDTTVPVTIDYSTNKIRMRGSHFDIVGLIPVTEATQVVASAGLAILNVRVTYNRIGDEGSLYLPDGVIYRNFIAQRAIPRFSGGFQHHFAKCYGMRGTVGYEGTGKFKNMIPRSKPDSAFRTTLKNSIIYSLGGFFVF